MTTSDTIYALSSGAGRAGLAVIRISGSRAYALLETIAGGAISPRQFVLRLLRDASTGEVLDQAVVVWLPGPRSLTGEDCAELHIHGSPAVISAVLDVLSRHVGVRPAEPGEFTRRAFANGKMDLVEIEGLADLLEARTTSQRRQALHQMSGKASSIFDRWREDLLLIRADIEAVVDFVDEAGVADAAAPAIDARIEDLLLEISGALDRSLSSEVIRDGVRVVLAGFPNTGKSSLLNVLARRDAAIVSDLPGTTRDSIEVALDVAGIPVILTDTAGIRNIAADMVEEEGIRRSRKHMADADVLVWVCSPDVPGSDKPDGSVFPEILVWNKADLIESPDVQSGHVRNGSVRDIRISTKTGKGIPDLLVAMAELLGIRYGQTESALLVSSRQKLVTRRVHEHLTSALSHGSDALELKAEEIRQASDEIGRLTGRVDVEEWLGAIFSRFCIGK
jgi:tRNA modification GTPase